MPEAVSAATAAVADVLWEPVATTVAPRQGRPRPA